MNVLSANGATLINSLRAIPQENRKLKRLALKARFIASLRRAFSAQSQFDIYPGALPQVEYDFALSALNK